MSSESSRLRFHMGCGERLQSRRWVVRGVSGALLRTAAKPGSVKVKQDQNPRVEDRDES